MHEAKQGLRVIAAVSVGDEGPGQTEHARIPLQRPARELRKLAVEAGWEIVLDFADLLVDDVNIVDQPLGGGRYRMLLASTLGDRAIGFEQSPAVVSQPCRKRPAGPRLWRNAFCGREALGMLLEALDAEEIRADWLFVRPGGGCRRTLEGMKD